MCRKIPAPGCSQVPGKDLEAPEGRAICHGCHAPRGTAGAADLSFQLLLPFMGLQGKKKGGESQESSCPPAGFWVFVGSSLELLMFFLPLSAKAFFQGFFSLPCTSTSQWITSHPQSTCVFQASISHPCLLSFLGSEQHWSIAPAAWADSPL